jgi:hypothetical protein
VTPSAPLSGLSGLSGLAAREAAASPVAVAVAAALRDCGPCGGDGPPVRGCLPPGLSPAARAAILARLDRGEADHGAPLRIGWAPAPVELAQELYDAVAYAVAAGVGGADLAALVILAERAAAGTLGGRP